MNRETHEICDMRNNSYYGDVVILNAMKDLLFGKADPSLHSG